MGFEITIKLSKDDLERLKAIQDAMNKQVNDYGGKIRIEAPVEQALATGMDELERIFELKRPKKIEPRDSYEQHDQLCLRLSF